MSFGLGMLAVLTAACGESPVEPPAGRCQLVPADAVELPPPAALLDARRQRLATLVGDGVVVLAAATTNPDPQNEGYRGDNNLFYLAGVDVPGSWLMLLVRGGQVDSTIVFFPESPETSGVAAAELTGADRVRCASDLQATLQQLLRGSLPLHRHFENPAATDPGVEAIRSATGAQAKELHVPLLTLRMVKDTAEVARLRRAADITARAVAGAVDRVRPGLGEADVAADILQGFVALGAERPSFPSIVAAGSNALTLHYNANNRAFLGSELVLIDVGAEFARYAGDVTRTFPVSGRFSARQRELYELVLGALEAATAAVRPGITMLQLERIARDYLDAHSGALCGGSSCERYFSHALSHSLGLNVHDPASYNLPLQQGSVITIEPGIYLPGEGIGIRIEDDVLVTATGGEVLSGAAPKTVAAIEALFSAR